MRTKYILFLCVVLFRINSFGHDQNVHEAITFSAAASAYDASPAYSNFVNAVSPDLSYLGSQGATNAMVNGSFDEDFIDQNRDVGGARSLNHFYDPTKSPPIGLTDKPWPLLSGPMGRDSLYWGSVSNATDIGASILLVPFNRGTSNIWSWPNARNYEWLGLTATNHAARQTNLANMFRAVGQVMHLLEDTSQPQHVRNEQHWDRLLNNNFLNTDLRSRSAIEDYGNTNVASLNYAHGMLDWRGAGFTQLKDFWNRKGVSPGLDNRS